VQGDADGEAARTRVASDAPTAGGLICTATSADGTLQGPILLWDGWHRAAVWTGHSLRGLQYPIEADLIITQQLPPLLGGRELEELPEGMVAP
jgi:hypothetical protein